MVDVLRIAACVGQGYRARRQAGRSREYLVTGLEIVVGFLVAWAVRKSRRVAGRVDAEVDQAMDAGLDRLHKLVAGKLTGEPSLAKLQAEVEESGSASPRTQDRVRLALEDAAENDTVFTAELATVVKQLQASGQHAGPTAGDHGVAITGGVRADGSGIAIGGVTGGHVSLPGERPDPSAPGRLRG